MRLSIASLLLAAPLQAQTPFTYEHVRRVVSVGALDVSPDGRQVVFTVSRPNYEVNRTESSLWLVDVAGGPARELTPGRTTAAAPRWSPDGRSIAFQAPDSAGRSQIWVISGAGGEAQRLTSSPTPVVQFAWRPDGALIAFSAEDEGQREGGEVIQTFEIGAQTLPAPRCIRRTCGWCPRPRGHAATSGA
jgi:dipeptidyl aminopeptidase/acylaminoacyl peptidase